MVSPFLDSKRIIIFYQTLLQTITFKKALLLELYLLIGITKSIPSFRYFFFVISEKLRYIRLLYFQELFSLLMPTLLNLNIFRYSYS